MLGIHEAVVVYIQKEVILLKEVCAKQEKTHFSMQKVGAKSPASQVQGGGGGMMDLDGRTIG